MLVCLACSKQASLGTPTHADENHHRHLHHHSGLEKASSSAAAPPNLSGEHFKSFTTQLKDIVMKFSSGAYRHCRPCTAAGGSLNDDNCTLCGEDDDKSSVLFGSHSQVHGSIDSGLHVNLIPEYNRSSPHEFGNASLDLPSSGYDLLPDGRNKRGRVGKKKASSTSSSKSSLFLKQAASRAGSRDAIEELLDEHFRREERLLAEEQSCASRAGGDHEIGRADHQLLEEAKLVGSRREHQKLIVEENLNYGDDGHVKRGKRHKDMKGMESGEEWVAQVEPGVVITFVALSDGSNHLKRIRFSRELFSKWQAQLWWTENSETVQELYSVRKMEPPFKACLSARSSSSRASTTTTCSLHHQHTLQNTPELQSRVGSHQASPSNTPRISRLSKETKSTLSPTVNMPSTAEVAPSMLTAKEAKAPLRLTMEQHDNPLFENPEFELCYKEGIKGGLGLPNGLWVSTLEDHVHQWQGDKIADDVSCSSCELVHELKRVKFNN